MRERSFDVAPYRFSGTVYGVAMNHLATLDALGSAVNEAPYKAAPKAVVLYVKPRNTFIASGGAAIVDSGAPLLEAGAALGIVIGRTASAVSERDAAEVIAGYVIAADFSVPHTSYFRPSIRFKARDASFALGSEIVSRADVADAAALGVRVYVDGRLAHETSTGQTLRGVARLVAEVSDFITLMPGDVLLAGVAPGAPQVAAGQRVGIEIDGLGRLDVRVESDAGRVA